MPQQVTAFSVMISGPSDVADAMVEIRDSLTAWSSTYMKSRSAVLIPLDWKRDSVPQLGASGQEIINHQLLDRADILFAAFRHKIGTATDDDISGTAEEIRKAHESRKPVHVYFDRRLMPYDGDPHAREQFDKVLEFKRQLQGLYDEYEDIRDLRAKVWQAIEHDLADLPGEAAPVKAIANKASDLIVQPRSERVLKGTDARGRAQYKTNHWIDVINRGHADALDVMVELVAPGPTSLHWPVPKTIYAGESRNVSIGLSMGEPSQSAGYLER